MLRIRSAARSEIGHVRRRNEDRYLCEESLGLFGVADGVGGLPGGAEAAQAAHDSLIASFRQLPPGAEPDLAGIVNQANATVVDVGRRVGPGIATTLTFGCLRGGQIRIGHAGDSRAYGFEQGRLHRLTEDHNVANEARRKQTRGEVMPYLAAESHAITRCLGHPIPPEAEWITRKLAAGNRYFFCTDGVSGLVSDPELAGFLASDQPPETVLQELIDLVLRRGAPDNATGVLVRIDSV